MANVVQFDGPLGASRPFSACPVNRWIILGGTALVKVDDARACRSDNGVLQPIAPDQFVTLIEPGQVTVNNPLQTAENVAMGGGYTSGGHTWMRCQDGALNMDTLEFVFNLPDSGDVRIGTGLTVNIDQ